MPRANSTAPSFPHDRNGTQQSAGDPEKRPRLLQRYWERTQWLTAAARPRRPRAWASRS